jgi:hypothetical protein
VDLFLAYCHVDEEFASGLGDTLGGRGLVVGEPLPLWPGQRLLTLIDQRLAEARFALVVVSLGFLRLSYPRKELDGLTIRRKVLPVLVGIDEVEVTEHSPRLAVAALPSAGNLVRLIRPND